MKLHDLEVVNLWRLIHFVFFRSGMQEKQSFLHKFKETKGHRYTKGHVVGILFLYFAIFIFPCISETWKYKAKSSEVRKTIYEYK